MGLSTVWAFYLEAMADRRAKTVTNLISNNFIQMEKALTVFADEGIEDQEHLRKVIGRIKQLLSLNRLALVDEDDIVYTQYTTYTGGSRYDFLAGDQLIKDASVMLCEYFRHGAVFRTGGDEFVVVLQGRGFDTKDEVINEFNRKVEGNIATGDVVVSIGCSTLKDGDEQLKDIFKRADQLMYERKKELKGMGAKTRDT